MKKAFFVVIAAILSLFGGIMAWHLYSRDALQRRLVASAHRPVVVSVAKAARQTWATTMTSVGSVAALRGADLSPQVGGVVQGVDFRSGEQVPAGKVLLTLDPGPLPGKLAKARSEEALARVNYVRTKGLYAIHGASQAALDKAEYTWRSAEAQVNALREALDEYRITAPFAGVLGLRTVNPGEYLHAGEAVVHLEDLDRLYVDFTVPQKNLGEISLGAPVELSIHRGEALAHYSARVSALDSHVTPENRAVRVRALIVHPDGLRPGMFVKVTLRRGEPHPVLAIPITAVTFNTFGDFVYVVDARGKGGPRVVHEQPIQVGEQQGNAVAVVSGLSAGTEVVTAGQVKLHSGDSVTVNNAVSLGG